MLSRKERLHDRGRSSQPQLLTPLEISNRRLTPWDRKGWEVVQSIGMLSLNMYPPKPTEFRFVSLPLLLIRLIESVREYTHSLNANSNIRIRGAL